MIIEEMTANARLALDTIHRRPVKGIPSTGLNIMEHSMIDRLAGAEPGSYVREPEKTYLAMQKAIGACLIDQFIPRNPLTMGSGGYEDREKEATTGLEEIRVDGILIDSPEAVVEHMEKFVFPSLKRKAREFDEDSRVAEILAGERAVQDVLAPEILKSGYAFIKFPCLRYGAYGYANYFMAYALYPEVMERDFSLQADFALLNNRAAARAYAGGGLPPLYRLDHDMADSRGTLVSMKSLDRIWFPHFARCLQPVIKTDVRMMWHCDGNLMQMVPRLIETGVRGFQGFQYEDGMDYEKICAMKTREGEDLVIKAGVSVTKTLPKGKPGDVRKELKWLAEKGPKTGLFLAVSSSVAPGVPWENIEALIGGLAHYRTRGRAG